MKITIKAIIALALILILISNFVFFVAQKISGTAFWVTIVIIAIAAYLITRRKV